MLTNEEFDKLVDEAREWSRTHPRTPEEERAFAVSFAYGNLVLDGCEVTREDVEKAYDEIHKGEIKGR